MKSRKGISVLLSLLLVFNVFLNGTFKVKAEEITNSLEVLSVSVDKTNVDINKEVNVTVEANSTLADLSNEAYGVYVLKTDKQQVEKEFSLTFDKSDMKYHGKVSVSDESLVGLWSISWLSISDTLGNAVAFYNSKVHEGIGQDLSAGNFNLFVDKSAPTFSKINLSKHAAKAGDNVNVSIDAADDLSGLASQANLVYVLKTDAGDIEKEVTLNLDGSKYTANLAINKTSFQEGLWQLSYIALGDNSSNRVILYNSNVHENLGQDLKDGNLLVDYKNPEKPQITLSTTKPTNQNVKVTIASEKDAKIEYKLEGQNDWTEYKGVFEVEKNTKVQARVTDLAGNVGEISEVEISNIDMVAPIVTIENLDKEFYNVDVKPVIKVDDSMAIKTVLLNGIPYNGTAITSEGEYTLRVVATDEAGNSQEVIKKFTIDKTAPKIDVQGVENGKTYKTAEPKITINEQNITTKLSLNGKPYDGKAISQDGQYELKIDATDRAGNTSSITVKFVVDNGKGSSSSSSTSGGKLAKTGSPIDMNVLVGLGILLIGAGFTIMFTRRKRSQN